jgi:hypothetical protein
MRAEELLTETQISALKTLGILEAVIEKAIELRDKPKSKKSNEKPAEEYMLEVEQTCRLCGTMYNRLYFMKVTPDAVSVLTSQLIAIDQLQHYSYLPYMLEKRVVATCGGCRKFLSTKSNSELISIILRSRRYVQVG